jgi:hypothetical protein
VSGKVGGAGHSSVKPRATVADLLARETTAAHLVQQEFSSLAFAVAGIWPPGLSVLVGPPKMRKSMLVLQLLIGIAAGGRVLGGKRPTNDGRTCVYAALEDGPRRLHSRLLAMCADDRAGLDQLHIVHDWPALTEGGADLAAELFAERPGSVLVLDTLARLRGDEQTEGTAYERDVRLLAGLQSMVEQAGGYMMLVHHTRKAASSDWLDRASGSLGLTGTADAIWLLDGERDTDEAVLHVAGRDLPADLKLPLRFDVPPLSWVEIEAEELTVGRLRETMGLTAESRGKRSGPPSAEEALAIVRGLVGVSAVVNIADLTKLAGRKGVSAAQVEAALGAMGMERVRNHGREYVHWPKRSQESRRIERCWCGQPVHVYSENGEPLCEAHSNK